jgi:hypothetical protein
MQEMNIIEKTIDEVKNLKNMIDGRIIASVTIPYIKKTLSLLDQANNEIEGKFMETTELLQKINGLCFEAERNKLELDTTNDFPSGCVQGASVLAGKIIELLKKYGEQK